MVKLPHTRLSESDNFEMLRSSLNETFDFVGIKLPVQSVTDLSAEEYKQFAFESTLHDYCVPVSVCWTSHGDLLVGCAGGQLLKVTTCCCRVFLWFIQMFCTYKLL